MEIRQYPFTGILAVAIIVYSVSAASATANTFRDCSECPEMVEIPKGSFLMGSDIGRDDEMPRHRVSIGYNFAVSKKNIHQHTLTYTNIHQHTTT